MRNVQLFSSFMRRLEGADAQSSRRALNSRCVRTNIQKMLHTFLPGAACSLVSLLVGKLIGSMVGYVLLNLMESSMTWEYSKDANDAACANLINWFCGCFVICVLERQLVKSAEGRAVVGFASLHISLASLQLSLGAAKLIFWVFYGKCVLRENLQPCELTHPRLASFIGFSWSCLFIPVFSDLASNLFNRFALCVLLLLTRRGIVSMQVASPLLRAMRAYIGTLALEPSVIEDMQVIDQVPDDADTCCICSDTHDNAVAVVRTPCGHMMHKECLRPWLNLSRTCPLCRTDLEVALKQAALL